MEKVLNVIKQVIIALSAVLKFIGKIPVFLLPASLKGYRTQLLNILAIIAVALEGLDITGMCEALSSVIHLDCTKIQEIFAILVASANIELRSKTDTKVFESK